MCGHGTIGTVTIALENGLIQPKTPGLLRLDTPAGARRGALRAERPVYRERAHHQCPLLPLWTGLRGRRRGSRHAERGCRLWRQLLCHRRAAAALFRSRRRQSLRHPALEPQAADALQCAIRDRASREPGHRPSDPRSLDRAAARRRRARRATPCSTATRRSTARPAAPGPRPAWRISRRAVGLKEGDTFVHESIIGSTFAGASRGGPRSATMRPSFPRSRAGRG